MGDGHSQDRQFIRFPGQGGTRGHHVAQLGDVQRHLITSASLYLTMRLPVMQTPMTSSNMNTHSNTVG